MVTDQTMSERVLGAAKALWQERKSLCVDDIREYLKTVAHVHMPEAEVEAYLSALLNGRESNLPAVELHQAFVFKRAARGFWRGSYSILVVQRVYHLPEPTKYSGTGRIFYLVFGIVEDGEAAERFLGAARDTQSALKTLEQHGIEITGWFPLTAEQWQKLLPNTQDMKDIVDHFGESLFSPDGVAKNSFVTSC